LALARAVLGGEDAGDEIVVDGSSARPELELTDPRSRPSTDADLHRATDADLQ